MLAQVTRVAAYGLLVQEGKLLLCRLSKQLSLDAGYWTLPGGGLDFGEDPEAAMIRELKEETGFSVRSKGIAAVDSFTDTNEQRVLHSIRIIYHAEITGGELCHEENGSTDFCDWWLVNEAKALPLVGLAELGLALAFAKS